MDARELRIGNRALIKADYPGNPYDFSEAYITSDILRKIDTGEILCKGIELTEEWLKRFGFTRIKSITSFEIAIKEHLNLEIGKNPYGWDSSLVLKKEDEGLWFNGKIQSVHQLQNLYYALTHSELELTPER